MAITVSAVAAEPGPLYALGDLKAVLADVTFDSSYPTGGEALDPATILGLSTIVWVPPAFLRKSDNTDAVLVSWDLTNNKLLAYWGNAGTASAMPAVTNTTDLSAYSGRVIFYGR